MTRTDPRPNYGSGVILRRSSVHGWYRYRRVAADHPLAPRDRYVGEHRLVLFEAGIEVPPGFHVHHVNLDTLDNRQENLRSLSPAAHRAEHLPIGALVVNQYGVSTVGTPEERLARSRARDARRRAEGRK